MSLIVKYKRQKCHELPETVSGWLPQMLALLERKTREGSFLRYPLFEGLHMTIDSLIGVISLIFSIFSFCIAVDSYLESKNKKKNDR